METKKQVREVSKGEKKNVHSTQLHSKNRFVQLKLDGNKKIMTKNIVGPMVYRTTGRVFLTPLARGNSEFGSYQIEKTLICCMYLLSVRSGVRGIYLPADKLKLLLLPACFGSSAPALRQKLKKARTGGEKGI